MDDFEEELRKKLDRRYPGVASKMKLTRVVDKHYSFELDIARGQVECIRIRYSFDLPPIDIEFEGRTYHGIVGTTYKPTELVVLESRLMGPGWVDVEAPSVSWQKFQHSHLGLELTVDSQDRLAPSNVQEEVPRFSLASVSLVKGREAEAPIEAITLLYSSNYDVEAVQLSVSTTPYVFLVLDEKMKDQKKVFEGIFGQNLTFVQREYALLNVFIQKLNQLDPDIILGHDVINVFFEVIFSRCQKLSINVVSSLSRFKRDQNDLKASQKLSGLKKIRALTVGRMVCDSQLGSMENVRETNYELDFLAEKYLGEQNVCGFRLSSQDPLKNLIHLIDESLINAHLSLGICQKLQLVQLNKQLTNVAGCFWYQSFENKRAERNEMLLMHTFHRSGFIFPDKFPPKFSENKKAKKREKPKYAGGLVLEPKAGLYKDYILLLDFNSLYPSIIREYKICFTTVKRDYVDISFYVDDPKKAQEEKEKENRRRKQDDEEDSDEELIVTDDFNIPVHEMGDTKETPHTQILPKIVHRLIKKRQEVKNEIKKTSDKNQKETLDIKQKAYKLIANSIYGCLGFKNSRFYARQMAALITNFGRDILLKSSHRVDEMGHKVVYGDTDSLMINSGTTDLIEAMKKGLEIKKAINGVCKSKILEIDVDGVFRSLLLLKKKKYAADKLTNLDELLKSMDESVARFAIEKKGLDIVRRDWSGVTKNTGDYLVEMILNKDRDAEETVEEIYEYLVRLRQDLDAGRIALPSFVIYKQLNKDPDQYANHKGQPHVVVAKRMKAQLGYTKEQLINHFIPYVIVQGDPSQSFAERAFHPDEVSKMNYKPDVSWYTSNQLINPIARLLEYLPGIDMDKVAQTLGIDVKKLNSHLENRGEEDLTENSGSILYYLAPSSVALVSWTCTCGHKNKIDSNVTSLSCQKKEGQEFCGKFPTDVTVKNEVASSMKRHLQEYYGTLFTSNRKGGEENSGDKNLPIVSAVTASSAKKSDGADKIDKQDKEVAEAVAKVNSTLFGLETIFNSNNGADKNLGEIKAECYKKINEFRKFSMYEHIQFGTICSKVKSEQYSSRHYALLKAMSTQRGH